LHDLIAITGDNADLSELQAVANGPFWGWNGVNYEYVATPKATQSIWINSTVAKRVDVSSEKSDAKIKLAPGWNLVGPIQNTPIPDGVISVFSYDEKYIQVYLETGVLIKGVGYWIFSE